MNEVQVCVGCIGYDMMKRRTRSSCVFYFQALYFILIIIQVDMVYE